MCLCPNSCTAGVSCLMLMLVHRVGEQGPTRGLPLLQAYVPQPALLA